tara:strand:- start:40 stop:786 length:747 start_codon:yes stop_codon:yes gene_type:complete
MKNNFFYKNKFTNIYKKPSQFSEITSQILYGEKFKILSKNKNWLKIKTSFDNYIGYIKNKNYSKSHLITHKVFVLKTNIFNNSRKKTKNYLPFASKISIIKVKGNFIEFEKDKWIKKSDIKKINHNERSFVKIFKLFLGSKYLWGGKTYEGIDCSAILQMFYYYNNKFYPRDTNYQIKYFKNQKKNKEFKKGNVIFWKGHVAICIDSKNLIHAYGPEKKVLIMPIKKTILRIENTAKLTVKKVVNLKF